MLYLLIFYLHFTFHIRCEYFIQIFTRLYFLLVFYYLLDCVEMIIFEHIRFELFELLITERASMMTINNLLNTSLTKYMPASSNICIFYLVQTNCTLKLCLEFVSINLYRMRCVIPNLLILLLHCVSVYKILIYSDHLNTIL